MELLRNKDNTELGKMGRHKGSINKNKELHQLEYRQCICGCKNIFICEETSSQKYIYGHNNRGKSLLKGYKRDESFKNKIRKFNLSDKNPRRISREIRYCECGCGESFIVKINSKKKYVSGHNDNDLMRVNCGYYLMKRLGVEIRYQSSYEKKVLEILDNCKDVLSVSRASFRIPYMTSDFKTHMYCPDFLVVTKNKTYIVEPKSTFIYNIHNGKEKLEVGKKFAKENNLGYLLIMDVHKDFSSVTTTFSEVIQKATATTQELLGKDIVLTL